MTTIIKIRRDTASNWTDENPVLALGEPGYETDTYNLKVGDGSTDWANLPYVENPGNINFANTAGTVTTAAQPNITSVGTLHSYRDWET